MASERRMAGMTDGAPKRRGPRPKISAEAIADAVIAIGFDEATVKEVAERLGVSVAGLYHHVRGREDLLRLGSERMLSEGRLPSATRKSWREWLREVAHVIRTHLAAHPELVAQYLQGGAAPNLRVRHVEYALEALVGQGFSTVDAYAAYRAVGQLALGAAVDDLREQVMVDEGTPAVAQMVSALATDPEGLPRVRALLESRDFAAESFDQRLCLLLDGIAQRADPTSTGSRAGSGRSAAAGRGSGKRPRRAQD